MLMLRLEDSAPEAFEVGGFGAVGHDGVVGAGAGGAEDLDAFVGGACGAFEEVEEFVHGEEAGAGAGDEEAVGLHAGHGEFVEVEVFSAAFEEVFLGGDQFGGIEDDDIVFFFFGDGFAEEGEGIGVDGFEFGGGDFVEVGVAFGECDGVFVEVNGGDVLCVAQGGSVEAEAAGVAAEVEQVGARGELGECEAVFALVAEEAGFVAVGEVDLEADFVFGNDGGFSVGGAVALGAGGGVVGEGEAFGFLVAFVGAGEDFFDAEEFFEGFRDGGEAAVHGEGEEFDDGEVAKFVDDEAGEGVAFGVDDAVGVGGGVEVEPIFAEGDGGGKAVGDEGFVDGGAVEGEHAEADGGVEGKEGGAEGFGVAVVDGDEIAVFGVGGEAADHFFEDGGVEEGVAELDPGEGAFVVVGGHAALGGGEVCAGGGVGRAGGRALRAEGAVFHGGSLVGVSLARGRGKCMISELYISVYKGAA